jgi:hypothetical protein
MSPSHLEWCSVFRRSNPCNCCPPLPFIVTRGGAQGEIKRDTVLGSWHVPSYIVVCQGALKLSRDALSWEPPRGWARLFILGRLAPSLSSLYLS